ncbi:MAG: ABC transporter ATP-binding protein [Hydrogenibacillus schlegelii]|uniref:ABC transporter ATP-binding protein n=1 Tax=Hydrogenibacillus schlegelii TaxID=1484 RepID=A0A947GAB1_HYDSH|nr:ABC transporter ATP-binding protein [Hydrogenibacillus schlegelii]
MEPLLSVRNLTTLFTSGRRAARAVDGVDLDIFSGETLALVGESGSGKSVTSLSILRLIPDPPGKIVAGEIRFEGRDLLSLSEREMNRIRGRRIAMIFQEPMTALNPVFTIGEQLVEAVRVHRSMRRSEAERLAATWLERVGIGRPEAMLRAYPHQLSGGQRQRVMIAMAMINEPALLIADEPTTALDVTIQAQILDLMRELKRRTNTALLLITHDLGVVAEMADRVAVMYAGQIVEEAPAERLFDDPRHPYTRGLIRSMPRLDDDRPRLEAIPGTVPPAHAFPPGCRFAPRCPFRTEACAAMPALRPFGRPEDGHRVRCHLAETLPVEPAAAASNG